ncbi:hypothetical protein ES708_16057 [subsurface metagenome]
MRFIDWIIEELEDISDFFYDAYQEVKDWVWPFYLLKYPLYGIYGRFHWLAEWFEDFNEWVDDTAYEISHMLTSWDIFTLLETWLDWAADAWYWVRSAPSNVISIVTDWWTGILPYILSYVDSAVEGLADLAAIWDNFWTVSWPGILDDLDLLRANWSQFWSITFPTLVSFAWLTTWWDSRLLDISSLLESWTLTLAPFWAGWQEIRDQVFEFFADPLEWLWGRFTDWFLGPEV